MKSADYTPPPLACAAVLMAGALCGCRSAGAGVGQLPFHVAILPVEIHVSDGGDASSGAGTALQLDAEAVRERLEEVLGERCFVQVSSEPTSAGETLDQELADAVARGADLVLACTVSHDPVLLGKRNEKFWLNLPLFLLGGPFCYFIDDHSYLGNARLGASLMDVHALIDGRASIDDRRSEYAYLEARVSEVTLDFLERAGGVGPYALSIVVPSGLLAMSGERVEGSLARSAADALADALAEEILRSTDALRGMDRVCSFFLAEDAEATADEHGTVVRGRVLSRSGSSVRFGYCEAHLGDATARVELVPSAAIPGSRYDEHPFELVLAARGPAVRLEIHTRGRDLAMRSYTLAVK